MAVVLCVFTFVGASCYSKGKVDGKYNIRFYENYVNDNKISGKYAYESTLRKYGDKKSSYLYFTGYQDYQVPLGCQHLLVKDVNGNVVEEWHVELHSGQGYLWMQGYIKFLSGKNKGKTLPVYIDRGKME